MMFKSWLWRPVAAGLSAINLVGVGFAAGSAEPWHAGVHATLALAFGLAVQRLGMRQLPAGTDREARLDDIEAEVSLLRGELSETLERLDFAERLLAQRSEAHRVGPESHQQGS